MYPGVLAPLNQATGLPGQGAAILCEEVHAVVTAVAEPVGKDWNVVEVWVTVQARASTPD